MKRPLLAAWMVGLMALPALAQSDASNPPDASNSLNASGSNRIDLVRPDAPELAAIGEFAVGVRTIELVDPGRIDILKVETGKPRPTADRRLTVEVWYPGKGSKTGGTYEGVLLRDGRTRVQLHGRAVRDLEPTRPEQAFPVVVISHGYPGNRFLLSPLAENLASKGYVVASIDHRDSTYDDQQAFASTLVNRPLDQLFVLDALSRLAGEAGHFLNGLADADNAALIGYSMGGYGALITAGAGVTAAAAARADASPDGTLAIHQAGSQSHGELVDERYRTVIAFAPWGMQHGVWDGDGLAGIEIPLLFVAGSADSISGYDEGVKAIFEQAANSERYLLTFLQAGHNAGAPMPAPAESWTPVDNLDFVPFEHYADPVWDSVRMNNISQHFATAWLDWHLKLQLDKATYFDLVPEAADGVWSIDANGSQTAEHSHWRGFGKGTALGLRMEYLPAGE